jgi:hypothetical protein
MSTNYDPQVGDIVCMQGDPVAHRVHRIDASDLITGRPVVVLVDDDGDTDALFTIDRDALVNLVFADIVTIN